MHRAAELLDGVAERLRQAMPQIKAITVAGDLRRGCELVGDLALVATAPGIAETVGNGDVTVHLTPENKRRPLPLMDPSTPGPDLSLPPEALPRPRKIELDGNLSRSWWRAPAGSANAGPAATASPQQAEIWHPKSESSLTDSVQLLRPAPLEHPLGEDPGR